MEPQSLSKTEKEELILCFYYEFQRDHPFPSNSPCLPSEKLSLLRRKWEGDRTSFLERQKQKFFNNPSEAKAKLAKWLDLKKNLSPLE